MNTTRFLAGAALAVTVSGCNIVTTDISGQVGVTMAHGHPTILVLSCDAALGILDVSGDRTGLNEDEENPRLGHWTAATPETGLVELDPANPAGWSGAGWEWETGRVVIVGAGSADEDVAATPVIVNPGDLDRLSRDQVQVGDTGKIVSRAEFEKGCAQN